MSTGAADHAAEPVAVADRRLDRDAAERVLRRAVELDSLLVAEEQDRSGQRLSVQALIDAADELDIDAAGVRRAVVEEELGLLSIRRHRTDPLVGPDRFVTTRVIEGTDAEVADRIDAWMCRGRVLRRSRARPSADGSPDWVDYARRSDPAAGAQRTLHAVLGNERLAHVRRVRTVVRGLDERRCMVVLVVDASRSRANASTAAAAVTISGTLTSAAVFHGTAAFAALGAAASAGAGIGIMAVRRAYSASVPDELEAVLDAVESGRRPTSAIDDVTSRLRRATRR